MGLIEDLPLLTKKFTQRKKRPLITLCYAQSLDGSISTQRGTPLLLSSKESFEYLHRLRASYDGILVGIGTVLADDPRLTVRLVKGKHPQPIILDSKLRFPLSARLLRQKGPSPWIFTTEAAEIEPQKKLENAGASIFRIATGLGDNLDLREVLSKLYQFGIQNIMVEGGARIITSFLEARLVDYVAITLVPIYVGGLRAVEAPLFPNHNQPLPREAKEFPHLMDLHLEYLGRDLVITGRLE